MKKILIITDGKLANHFIQRILDIYTSENIYYVIQTKKVEFKDINPARFKFYEFDPTSLYKLSNLLKMEFVQVIIIMDKLLDIENTIKNIRCVKKHLRIIVLDKWNIKSTHANIVYIKEDEILSSKLVDYLPNVPVIAQNVGLGEGEIMEIVVPFGSAFVYRHLGAIEQNGWRIVAMYRDRKLLMPSRHRMIQPNDLLLLVGEPTVLNSVYKAIKRELGQFPQPFGSNIYLYIDMLLEDNKYLKDIIRRALFIYKKFHKKLYIKIFNATKIDFLKYVKDLSTRDINIDIDYSQKPIAESLKFDIKKYQIGLIIVSKNIFKNQHNRIMFYKLKIPILKIGNRSLSKIKDVVLILTQNRDLEKVSTTIFDISSQMGFNLELINYLHEKDKNKEQVIEHFNNLSTIFSKTIKVTQCAENPIHTLKIRENFLHAIPLTKKMTSKQIYSIFSIDSEKLYYKLDDFHQIFVPSQL